MTPSDLRNLDLNLLVALYALLTERSVTGAAHWLGVTQSAASQSLRKLRQHFDDDLLVRQSRQRELTPFASELQREVAEVVQRLGDVLATGGFDPSETTRTFTLSVSDNATYVLAVELVEAMAAEAPLATLRFAPLPSAMGEKATRESLRDLDVLVIPAGLEEPGEMLGLYCDEWVCVADPGGAPDGSSWKPDDLPTARYVLAELNGFLPAGIAMRRAGINPTVAVTVSTFAGVARAVEGSSYVGVMQHRLAAQMVASSNLEILDWGRWQPASIYMVGFYDKVRGRDPGVRWFLDLLTRVAISLAPDSRHVSSANEGA